MLGEGTGAGRLGGRVVGWLGGEGGGVVEEGGLTVRRKGVGKERVRSKGPDGEVRCRRFGSRRNDGHV